MYARVAVDGVPPEADRLYDYALTPQQEGLILPGMMEGYEPIPWVRKKWLDANREKGMELLKESEKAMESEENGNV